MSDADRQPLARSSDDAEPSRFSPKVAAASAGLHGLVAVLLIGGSVLLPKLYPRSPETPPEIELVVGNNASRTGQAAPSTPAPEGTAQSSPETPAADTADASAGMAAAEMPADQGIGAASAAPPLPRSAASRMSEPSRPLPVRAASRAPSPRGALAASIRIGDGIAAAAAEIERKDEPHRAEADFGNLPPDYPSESARRLERGTVVLRVFIGTTGDVTKVEVVKSSGFRLLDQSARERVQTWHYKPAMTNGSAVPDIAYLPIRFIPE